MGPTAVGKTELAINLAQKFEAEIISADSRQFYRELEIGTAKPSKTELETVNHHFINSHSVDTLYSAGDFERDVDNFLGNYFTKKPIAIMVGGSGLFIKAVLEGLDNMPSAPVELRTELMQQLHDFGLEPLVQQLLLLDPESSNHISLLNPQRVVRALEVCIRTGQPFSVLKSNAKKQLSYNVIKIGLELPRQELYDRINTRVDVMINNGLLAEVKSLLSFKNHNALQTVAYNELFDYLAQKYTLAHAIDLIKQNTRRYAKRQLTWFKNQDNFEWLSPLQFLDIENLIFKKLEEINQS